MSSDLVLVEAYDAAALETVRALFGEYAASLDFDLCFQGFSAELAGLPGDYAPPDGRLFLALARGRPLGCVALRRLDATTAEMKRLFVRRGARGRGLGRALAEAVIGAARAAGYKSLRLDTVPGMVEAGRLYASLGFVEVPAYRYNPIPGVRYLELSL
ncbi:MAG: GNAT family N-acetyltransferase [Chloroflexota bacterium]